LAAPDIDGLLGGALALLTLAVAVADHGRYVIPDRLSAAAAAIGLFHAALTEPEGPRDGLRDSLLRCVLVGGAFLFFRLVYHRLRDREGIGLGDVKLAGVAGLWLSLPAVSVVVEIAAVTALGAYLLRQRARKRGLRADARLPFGLFFAPAIWLGWLFETISTSAPFTL
jgi:leader peptidase (prepilin peptidase)/N-methyltransferase